MWVGKTERTEQEEKKMDELATLRGTVISSYIYSSLTTLVGSQCDHLMMVSVHFQFHVALCGRKNL